jgi:hypothetical protein
MLRDGFGAFRVGLTVTTYPLFCTFIGAGGGGGWGGAPGRGRPLAHTCNSFGAGGEGGWVPPRGGGGGGADVVRRIGLREGSDEGSCGPKASLVFLSTHSLAAFAQPNLVCRISGGVDVTADTLQLDDGCGSRGRLESRTSRWNCGPCWTGDGKARQSHFGRALLPFESASASMHFCLI